MTSSAQPIEWTSVTSKWNAAALELRNAVEADCQTSSASRDAFTPALRAIGAVVASLQGARDPSRYTTGTSVPKQWREAINHLADVVRDDTSTSSPSSEFYGPILDRMDGIESMTAEQQTIDDAMTEVRDFLQSGRALDFALTARRDPLSESDVTKVPEHAVQMHDAPRVPAPAAKPLAWIVDAEDDCIETATTPFGFYTLQVFPKGCTVKFSFGASGRRVFEVMSSTRDQGAAAAQADLTSRIQECLATPPYSTRTHVNPAAAERPVGTRSATTFRR